MTEIAPERAPLDVFEAMRTSRAVRRYRPDPVPDDVLLPCVEAATWAPSGSNRQAWRFVVLRDRAHFALLGPAYRQGWAELSVGYGLAGFAPDDTSKRARTARTMQRFVDRFEEIPAAVLFCVGERDRPVQLSDGASIYPAVQNFLLAARAQGLGGVVTTWFQYVEDELRAAVGIPDDWLLAALVTVGWPEGRHGPVKRRPLSDVACVDRWDQPVSDPSTVGPASR